MGIETGFHRVEIELHYAETGETSSALTMMMPGIMGYIGFGFSL